MAAVSSSAEYNRMKEVKEFDETKMGVKGLTDSGITTIPKFFVQMPEVRSTLKPCSEDPAGIPLIDLSRMNSPDHRPRIVDELREAARQELGFLPKSIKSFHEQPQELKAKHYVRAVQSGYASNIDLFRSKAASWHDFVHMCMSPEPADVDQIPDACRSEIVAWDKEATMVAETVAELLSEGLGVAAGKLREAGLLATKTIAGVYYPFCPQPDLTLGLNHHTDPGIISNGEYTSVEHRVLANSSNEPRISIVEFFNVDERVESHRYRPLPELVTPESPARYRNFTIKEYHDNLYSKGLDSKSLVEKLMV
ncbi:hypothetical protein RHGRI_006958 [Rhododendron griersonianum]|uniref:Uncharacterized protein n=1 Tax=Rhododendron griersonianum TaxID=479676 RepID=A0AAV6KXP8_9ERIC|nr:hypothetical protein RHGRI_006958 [Rhododendron griersonianum]